MKKLIEISADISTTLWVGGLWVIGYLVAPLLFSSLASNHSLAGTLAGQMFKGIAWVGLACGSILLLHELLDFGMGSFKRLVFWLVALMLAITLVMQFWLQPFVIALRAMGAPMDVLAVSPMRSFKFWHGVSSTLYLVESLFGLLLVLKRR